MESDPSRECPSAVIYQEYLPLKITLWCIVFLCISTVVTTSIYFARFMCSALHHGNYKVLLSLYLLSFIAHSVFLGTVQAFHLYKLSYSHPCDLAVTNHFCYWFRHPTNTLTTMMTFTQFAITIERCIAAILGPAYDKLDTKLGAVFFITSIIASEAFSIRQQWPKTEVLYTYYCSAAQLFHRMGPIGLGSEWFLLIIMLDLFSLIAVLTLSLYYRRHHTRIYSMPERFERVRNTNVLAGLVPVMVFHSVYLVFFIVIQMILNNFVSGWSDVSFKTLCAALNIIPIYTTLAPVLMMYMQNRNRQNSSVEINTPSGDDYFEKLDEQWDRVKY